MSRRRARFQYDPAQGTESTEGDPWISRGARRNAGRDEVNARRALAAELAALDPAKWAQVAPLLDDPIRQQIPVARGLKASGARDRQLAYLARLLEEVELEPVRAFLRGDQAAQDRPKSLDRAAEDWRTRLLTDGDVALTALVERFPDAPVQALRQHARQSTANDEKKAKRARTLVYRAVRALLEAESPTEDEPPAG